MDRRHNRFITASHIRLLLGLIGLSLAWIVFAKLIAPPFIESAYRGESWSLFNRMISGQAQYSSSHYLQKWDRVMIAGLLGGLGFYLIALVIGSPTFFRRFVGNATPGSLGAIRMWTCLVLLLTTSLEDFASIALLPVEMRQHGGAMQFIYSLPIGFEALVRSETGLRVFQWFTESILILGAIGAFTRVVIPVGALCHLLLLGTLVDYSFFWHQNLVLLYVMAVLSFTPCGDGWSLDRLWKVYRGRVNSESEQPSAVYGWSRYACWSVIALPYLQAGLSKLRDGGLLWWSAASMRANLYGDTLNPREFNWDLALSLAPAPDFVFALLGIFAIVAELAFVMVLFSRVARQVLPFVAIMMHAGILALQRILFLDLILMQLVFFDLTKIRKAIGQWVVRHRGGIQVLYDGSCPLCRRTVRLLARLDMFARLQFIDFRLLDLNEYNRARGVQLKKDDLEKQMHVISRERAYSGFYGYRIIALALPAFWLLAPWFFLPLVSTLGAVIYGYIAHHRMNHFACESDCSVEPSEQIGSAGITLTDRPFREFRYVLGLSAIVLVSSVCWLYHVEFYPLTSWDVYSYSDVSGRVSYVKVFGVDKHGVRFPARFEDGIGALAYDGRYSRIIQRCFGEPADVDVCKKFLSASAFAHNQKARPDRKLTQYEIQKWTWDFRNNPSDPNYGTLAARFPSNGEPRRAPTATTFENRQGGDIEPQSQSHLVEGSAGGRR